jgi:hypothetical protein
MRYSMFVVALYSDNLIQLNYDGRDASTSVALVRTEKVNQSDH